MNSKIIGLVGPLLICGSLSGQAATISSLGSVGSIDFKSIGDSFAHVGAFTDIYTFSVGAPVDLHGSLAPLDFSLGLNISIGSPQLFSGTPSSFALVAPNGGCNVTCNWDIAAGTYFLQIAGNVTNSGIPFGFNSVGYAGSILSTPGSESVSQTPLPAALSLFASGLGAMGLLGWWRKRKARALAATA
jgi:hypothetical protein